ncbi:hypothetical protein BUALT_Bualt07G0155000 [Buddleja alternifolia]|uniref:Uncharacterized protein n=1 Tax=Buddleja alternifolia TaxID=168488 RepID=A0AAV6XCB0_9LAMI|nr:hypothetical protein BUALT_Bualt07G0155000 [Buddleja alternifolia]
MAEIVIILTLDKTIIELNIDNWMVDELGCTDLFNQQLPTMPWNSLMDRMMKELHAQGKTIEDIKKVLRRIPYILGLCDLRIVSDANMLFIEIILDHLCIKNCFSEINSNPSYIDEEGKGMIDHRKNSSDFSHGRKEKFNISWGSGDFCPSFKLSEGDFIMPRKDFPIWDSICESRALVRAEIHE